MAQSEVLSTVLDSHSFTVQLLSLAINTGMPLLPMDKIDKHIASKITGSLPAQEEQYGITISRRVFSTNNVCCFSFPLGKNDISNLC